MRQSARRWLLASMTLLLSISSGQAQVPPNHPSRLYGYEPYPTILLRPPLLFRPTVIFVPVPDSRYFYRYYMQGPYALPVASPQAAAMLRQPGMRLPPQPPPPAPVAVRLQVRVPVADAEVWLEGNKTRQQGLVREFLSPPLSPGQTYQYHLKAAWSENEQRQETARTIAVLPGEHVRVDLTLPQLVERKAEGK